MISPLKPLPLPQLRVFPDVRGIEYANWKKDFQRAVQVLGHTTDARIKQCMAQALQRNDHAMQIFGALPGGATVAEVYAALDAQFLPRYFQDHLKDIIRERKQGIMFQQPGGPPTAYECPNRYVAVLEDLNARLDPPHDEATLARMAFKGLVKDLKRWVAQDGEPRDIAELRERISYGVGLMDDQTPSPLEIEQHKAGRYKPTFSVQHLPVSTLEDSSEEYGRNTTNYYANYLTPTWTGPLAQSQSGFLPSLPPAMHGLQSSMPQHPNVQGGDPSLKEEVVNAVEKRVEQLISKAIRRKREEEQEERPFLPRPRFQENGYRGNGGHYDRGGHHQGSYQCEDCGRNHFGECWDIARECATCDKIHKGKCWKRCKHCQKQGHRDEDCFIYLKKLAAARGVDYY